MLGADTRPRDLKAYSIGRSEPRVGWLENATLPVRARSPLAVRIDP